MTTIDPCIVHVASGREWRGGQRQVYLLARELARVGFQQLVVTSAGSRLARELTAASVPVAAVPWRAAWSWQALGTAWRAARRLRAVLHAHDAHALTLAGVAAVAARRRLVATKRTEFPLRRPGFWRRADRVIAVSGAVGRVLAEGGVSPERISVIPSGIDLEATRAIRAGGVRRELALPEETPLAVTVAAFTSEKDHATLLHAAAAAASQLPDLHWALAGDGPLRPSLERLARDLGLEARIHFLGWLDEPLRLMAAANVFVLTSTSEGRGTVLLDAMALGIPVVATEVGGLPETVGPGGLLVPAGNPDRVGAAVVRVLLDPVLRSRLVAEASHRVTDASAEGMARAVATLYRSLVLKH